jgi:hypothetical protein
MVVQKNVLSNHYTVLILQLLGELLEYTTTIVVLKIWN